VESRRRPTPSRSRTTRADACGSCGARPLLGARGIADPSRSRNAPVLSASNEAGWKDSLERGRVGRYVHLKAREGQRDVLVEHTIGVARSLVDIPGCELYVINTSATETDTVWVTEVWSSEGERCVELGLESVKAMVEQGVALLAEPPERIDILPLGGKGLDAG
jgi:quinol monooxygenase YgiN